MDHKLEVERFCSKSSEIGLVVETPLLGLIMKEIGGKYLEASDSCNRKQKSIVASFHICTLSRIILGGRNPRIN